MKKIALLGDVLEDIYYYGNRQGFSNEDPECPKFVVDRVSKESGGARNVLDQINEYGHSAFFYFFEDRKIRSKKVRLINKKNEHIVRLDLNYDEVNEINKNKYHDSVKRFISQNINAWVISDYNHGSITKEKLHLIGNRITSNQLSFINTRRPEVMEKWNLGFKFDYLFMNQTEAYKTKDIYSFAKNVIVTQGKYGLMFYRSRYFEPSNFSNEYNEAPISVTGAGDTVFASFISAKLRGCSDINSAKIANKMGNLKVSLEGTKFPSRDKFNSIVQDYT